MDARNVQVTTYFPYTHTSNPLCESQNRVVEQILRILMKQECAKDRVRSLPCAVLPLNSQQSCSTGYNPRRTVPWRASCMVFQISVP